MVFRVICWQYKKREYLILLNENISEQHAKEGSKNKDVTYIDELDLPDLLDQLHGGVTVDEEGLGVVAKLQ